MIRFHVKANIFDILLLIGLVFQYKRRSEWTTIDFFVIGIGILLLFTSLCKQDRYYENRDRY